MAKLIAQAQVWNAAQFITAPILAAHEHVDEIQIFDGAYRFLKEAGKAQVPHSTDDTERIVKSLKLACRLVWVPPLGNFYENEIAKKVFMLNYWHQGEWRYWLNDDEVPGGDIAGAFERVRKSKALVGHVRMWEPRFNRKTGGLLLKYLGWKPRFHRWQCGIHWHEKHWPAYDAQDRPLSTWPGIKLEEMMFIHLTSFRIGGRLLPQLDWSLRDKQYGS